MAEPPPRHTSSADWRAEIERVQAVADDIRSRSKLGKDEAFTLTLLDLIIEHSQLREELRIARFDADVPLRELREEVDRLKRLLNQRGKGAAEAEDQALRYREVLEHIAQSVGARANGQDARLMARYDARRRVVVCGEQRIAGVGFEYRQLIVWDKTPNVPPFGGSVAPNAAEFHDRGREGQAEVSGRWASSVVRARKARATHSRKPDVFLDLVEQVSPGPYVELFARRARFGWDYWGDQSLGTAEVPDAA